MPIRLSEISLSLSLFLSLYCTAPAISLSLLLSLYCAAPAFMGITRWGSSRSQRPTQSFGVALLLALCWLYCAMTMQNKEQFNLLMKVISIILKLHINQIAILKSSFPVMSQFNLYSQLLPCRHLAIKDTTIIRISPAEYITDV